MERFTDQMRNQLLRQSTPLVLGLLLVALSNHLSAGDAHWGAFALRIGEALPLLLPAFAAHLAACRWRVWQAISIWLAGFVAYPSILAILAGKTTIGVGQWVLVAGCSLAFLLLHPGTRRRDGLPVAGGPPILRLPITLDRTIAALLGLWALSLTSLFASTPDAVRNQPLKNWFNWRRMLAEPGETIWYLAQIALLAAVLYGWYWMCRYVLVQLVLRKQGIVPFALALTAWLVLGTPIAASIGLALPLNIAEWTVIPSENHNPFDPDNYRFAIWLTAIVIPVVLIVERLLAEQNEASAKHETVRAELHLLQQQINPHFLFNTLNTLYALCLKDRVESAGAVVKLSDLLRYVVYRGQAERVGLDEEIAYLANYLDLQQLRFGHRCSLQTSWPETQPGLGLAPLLLIMLIENAYKHGVEPADGPCWVQISMAVTGRRLRFECVNSIPSEAKSGAPGMGLANLHRRLELLYGQDCTLEVGTNEGQWRARLALELEPC